VAELYRTYPGSCAERTYAAIEPMLLGCLGRILTTRRTKLPAYGYPSTRSCVPAPARGGAVADNRLAHLFLLAQ
jgi:hypothetical protein